ncbi:MAG: hypothetical protein CK541_01630 [Opitutia bacterium]|nr:MAG: hypothetical protein CK541_01630 [Opitutae bacterium]
MSQPQSGNGESVLSLQNISRTFFTALQRQHDMLAFSIAGLHTADPKAYEHFSSMSRVMPVPQAHLPPEQMLAYARGLMMRTTVNDLLTLSSECMTQCHLLCLFIREQGKNQRRDPLTEKIISEKQNAFQKMTLQDRFTALEENFGIVCDLEDGVFSLAAALRVLVRGGLVTNDDITPDGALTLEFKSMKDFEAPAEPEKATEAAPELPPGVTRHSLSDENKPKMVARLTDTARTFKPGEMLNLTDSELLGLNITVAKFVDGLLRSVDHFGRAQLGEGA